MKSVLILTLCWTYYALGQADFNLEITEIGPNNEPHLLYGDNTLSSDDPVVDIKSQTLVLSTKEVAPPFRPQTVSDYVRSVKIIAFDERQVQLKESSWGADQMLSTQVSMSLLDLPRNVTYRYVVEIVQNDDSVKHISFRFKRFKWRILVRLDDGFSNAMLDGILATAAKTQVNISWTTDKSLNGTLAVFHVPFLRYESRTPWIENLELGMEIPVLVTNSVASKGWGIGLGAFRNKEDRTLVQVGYVAYDYGSGQKDAVFVGIEIPSAIEYVREWIRSNTW